MERKADFHILGLVSIWLFAIYIASLGSLVLYAWLRTGGNLEVLLDFLVFLTLMTGIALTANLVGIGAAIVGLVRAKRVEEKPRLAQVGIALHGLAMIASLLGTLYLIQQ